MIITKDKFFETVKEIGGYSYDSDYSVAVEEFGMEPSQSYKDSPSRCSWRYKVSESEKAQLKEFFSNLLVQKIYLGGMTGGSCWGGNPYYEYSEEKQEFTYLTELLVKTFPNITLLKYLEIKGMIKEVYMESREYYANTSDYLVYFVDLNELYNFLTEGMEGKNNGI